MEVELKAALFEAGKVAATAGRNFILASCVILLVISVDIDPDYSTQGFKFKIDKIEALSILLLVHAFMFYRAILATNYERVLGDCLKKERNLSSQDIWRLSYPGYFNHIQYAKEFLRGKTFRMTVNAAVLFLLIIVMFLPMIIGTYMTILETSLLPKILTGLAGLIYVHGILISSNFKMNQPIKIASVEGKNITS